jgi:hypothetical protein
LRPQLTFSLPLKRIGELFINVFSTKANQDTAMPPFLDNASTIERDPWKTMNLQDILLSARHLMVKQGPYRAKAHNTFLQIGILKYVSETILWAEADGLFLILCGYIYDVFFQNIEKPQFMEVGPKGFIKVISRIPFNQMYAALPEKEQLKFRELFKKYFDSYMELKVKPYRRDALEM